ncbi:Asp-tRNA(Asn)/Glu-tRNA(Gln) amidotransferase subunit GatA [Oscillospiraceae bacterium NSJ-64]|uniref:Glutamyl-tRNA(Gln) amidotransferase subunit A n=2 Tax=Youxingia wuxianensis TaxID=2763678 RepID=A0A926EJX8_9FIRM|nr:Asp-tRNA(Asn)/Glu-tRNA(Gln) amidotransferase subunit GatA [Youxingia wuxianensis]
MAISPSKKEVSFKMSIKKLHSMLLSKEFSCKELTQAYLDAVQRENSHINAYIKATPETALSAAKKVDEKLARGEELLPLEGIPMTLKDNISTKDIETTCCSNILKGYIPIYDATVWQILQKQNAVLLGKTNMDEFAMGSSCETSCFGGAKNPHNISHVAGGSSGGAAAAVAGNLAVYGLGSDTGGSIRQPASFCGIVGMKPTYGTVSRYGLIAYASSLDQIGPIASCVEDAALVYDAIAQYDPMDSTSQGKKAPVSGNLGQSLKGKKIGVPREYFDGVRKEVSFALQQALKVYESLGVQMVYFDLPVLKYALPVYYILACAEASSNLGRYDGIRYGYKTQHYNGIHEMICKTRSEGFGAEVKRRILLGNYVLSSGYYDAYYKKAQNLRGSIIQAFKNAFAQCDVILSPTVPMTAFKEGFSSQDQVETYLTDICTVPVNIAGLPAISIPCGFDGSGLPIGMQLIGDTFCEETILNAAYCFEQETKTETLKQVPMGVRL